MEIQSTVTSTAKNPPKAAIATLEAMPAVNLNEPAGFNWHSKTVELRGRSFDTTGIGNFKKYAQDVI